MNFRIFIPYFLFVFLSGPFAFAQVYKNTNGMIGFFSHTPVLDIEAVSKDANSIIDLSKNQLAFSVKNKTFKFKNSLMEEHFNEKYIESEKYPTSSFAGTINEKINLTAEGEYKVTLTGKLSIHGVQLDRVIPGTISVQKGKILLKSEFMVKTADYKIEVPQLVFEKIAEEIKVSVSSVILIK